MMRFTAIDQDLWGHRTDAAPPSELIDSLAEEVQRGIDEYRTLTMNHQPCDDADGYVRVNIELGVSKGFFDLFLNGSAGYRAQYAQGVDQGEAYNRAALDAILDMLAQSNNLFGPEVDSELCRRSLEGRYTKFWFPKSLTDPSGQDQLSGLPEVIKWKPWIDWWRSQSPPRKGLLAPMLDEPTILLNGSFVRRGDWSTYKQKADRSEQLNREGWT